MVVGRNGPKAAVRRCSKSIASIGRGAAESSPAVVVLFCLADGQCLYAIECITKYAAHLSLRDVP